ncbi:SHOCT domain-containing protein [Desulfotalea psychrophila]|uniref:SHOCT domain-containing protein n=1 Tax=Desulfotalea psychrophila TaxID=84980 RepID=UPI0002E07DCA|nr:SHOCT domain-containing protein [Desulfotalea psychrophila]
MWNNTCPNWGMGNGIGGGLVQMLLLALVIYIVYQLVASIAARRSTGNGEAAQILANRYARGEISAEEFSEIKKGLSK